MMRRAWFLLCIGLLALVWLVAPAGSAQLTEEADFSKGRLLGIGFQFTFPPGPRDARPDIFPASGLSARLWLADLLGIEVDVFVPSGPSFTLRSMIKPFNTEIADLYGGVGVAFYSFKGRMRTTFQLLGGIEISLSRNLALNAEVGTVMGERGVGLTAGLGAHLYF